MGLDTSLNHMVQKESPTADVVKDSDLSVQKKRKGIRIALFVQILFLSFSMIVMITLTLSFVILKQQRQRFLSQIIEFGDSLVYVAANNAPDKILAEEDLALIQLVNDIAKSAEVEYALITNRHGIIKAHSSIDEVGKAFMPHEGLEAFDHGLSSTTDIGRFRKAEEELLLFKRSIDYQGVDVGWVYLALSQKGIIQNIRSAKRALLLLMGGVLLAGIPVCFGLSLYFASPISRLRKGAEAIGEGVFTHRVKIGRNDELGDLGEAFNQMSVGLFEREFIRETFGKYVSPAVRDEILAGRVTLDGEKGVATLLFSDLRNFTPYVENNTPEEVVKSLRLYFTAMQRIITARGGLVLQYVGDEIEAVFGLPLKFDNHAEQAVCAALEMREALIKLNQERLSKNRDPFSHGIGIHTGEVLAGNSGSEDRLAYTMIGESVNLASRIQDLTKEVDCDLLASENTVKQLRGTYQTAKEPPHRVKGYSKPITVYQVLGAQES